MKITKTWHEDRRQDETISMDIMSVDYSRSSRRTPHNYQNPKPFVEVLLDDKEDNYVRGTFLYEIERFKPQGWEYWDMFSFDEAYPKGSDTPEWWQGVGLYNESNQLIWAPGDRTANLGEFTLTLEDSDE
jgi:hypothetical protein